MAKRRMKVGIIGCGSIANVHLYAYEENRSAEVVSIADLDEKARVNLAQEYSINSHTADYRELLANKNIDLVDICLPHYLHCKIAAEAFNAGKDVIVEKPIAMNLNEADEMIDTAKRLGKRFFVALNERFLPCNQVAKTVLEKDEIGRPFLVIGTIIGNDLARMNDPNHWKGTCNQGGGGVLIDSGMHIIDILQYFLGKVSAVNAMCRRLVVTCKEKAEDNAIINLEFVNGVLGQVAVTWTAGGNQWSTHKDIYGTQGSLHIVNEAKIPLTVMKNRQSPRVIQVTPAEDGWWKYSIRCGLDHFIDCILTEKEPQVTPEDARSALEIVLMAYESSKKVC